MGLIVLKNAGAIDVRERVLEFHINAPISHDGLWALRSAPAATLREKLAGLPNEQVARAERDAKGAVR